MAKFAKGSPQVNFRKRDGSRFTKTFHSRTSAARAIRAWRKHGGKVMATGFYEGRGRRLNVRTY